jgi:glucosamine-6-phosphate deaminase
MISNRFSHNAVPISVVADHPDVRFSYRRGGIGSRRAEMPRGR